MADELRDLRAKISIEADAMLDASVQLTGKDKGEIVREILHEIALKEIRKACLLIGICEERGIPLVWDGAPVAVANRKRERSVVLSIVKDLERNSVDFATEVDAGAGFADIVIYSKAGETLAVIEVKAACRSWREVHQASGQARGYADALVANACFVAAGEVEDKFLGERSGVTVCRADQIVTFFSGDSHVVSIADRR